MVDLEDAARSPPARRLWLRHVAVRTSYAWLIRSHVVGDGSRKDDWGRQLGGIDERPARERERVIGS